MERQERDAVPASRRTWRDWDDDPSGRDNRYDNGYDEYDDGAPGARRPWDEDVPTRGWDEDAPTRDWEDDGSREWNAAPDSRANWGDESTYLPGAARGARAGQEKPPKPKYYRPLLIALIVALLFDSALWIVNGVGYVTLLRRDLALVTTASAELQAAGTGLAGNPLSPTGIGQARAHMVNAYLDFSQLQSDLGQYPAVAQFVPHYGKLLRAAVHVMPLAVEASRAGIIGSDMLALLAARLHNPLDPSAGGLTSADMTAISQDTGQITAILNQASQQIAQLSPADTAADPRIAKAVGLFQTEFPKIQTALQAFPALPALLGVATPANYLLEVLDSTELRPGGGFIGNYGFVTIGGGRLSKLQVEDITLQEQSCPLYQTLPFTVNWYTGLQQFVLQDSNFEADFPATAVNMEKAYAFCGGTTPVTGVIAITPWWFKNALAITGNILVPEFNVTVTPQNLVDTIHYYQLGTQTLSQCPSYDPACRKHFTGLLLTAFFAKLRTVASGDMGALTKLIGNSIRTKDIQVYLNDPKAEAALKTLHIASAIEAPAQGDSLMVVDANVTPNKANDFMTYTVTDQVTIDGTGAAIHHTTITYNWPKSAESDNNLYGVPPNGNKSYYGYLRLYVPPNSQLLTHGDSWNFEHTDKQYGRVAWGGHFFMWYPNVYTISATWKVPGAAYRDASGWHYTYLMQSQAGITRTVNLQISLPACSAIQGAPIQLKQTGPHSAATVVPLTNDSTFQVNYTC